MRETTAIGVGVACLLLSGCGSRSGGSDLDRAELVLEPGAAALPIPADTAALPTPTDTLESNATPAVESATPDSPSSPSDVLMNPSPAAAESEPQAQVQTLELLGEEVASDDACRVWLDTSDSPLTQEDIAVRVDGDPWPSTEECGDKIAWQLTLDDSGAWLGVCPAACEQLAAQPGARMVVEATYWDEVPKRVR